MCTAAYRELLSHVSPNHVVLCPVTFSAGLLGALFEHNDHRYGLGCTRLWAFAPMPPTKDVASEWSKKDWRGDMQSA